MIGELWPYLNAAAEADAIWFTEAELYRHADDAARRLAAETQILTERDATTSTVAGTASYAYPSSHVRTTHMSAGGFSMIPATVQEVEALDDAWQTTQAPPERYLHNLGTEQFTLFPVPDAVETVAIVGSMAPVSTLSSGSPTVNCHDCMREWFLLEILAAARGREGHGAMPDMVPVARQMAGVMLQAVQAYYGN